jgi:hypothetical protein
MDNDMWTYGPWADFLLLGGEPVPDETAGDDPEKQESEEA